MQRMLTFQTDRPSFNRVQKINKESTIFDNDVLRVNADHDHDVE